MAPAPCLHYHMYISNTTNGQESAFKSDNFNGAFIAKILQVIRWFANMIKCIKKYKKKNACSAPFQLFYQHATFALSFAFETL